MFVLKHSEQLEQALAFLLFSYPCYLPSLQKWLIVCGCVTEPLNAKRLLSEYSSINQPVFFMTDGVDGAFPHYKRCPHPRCRTTNVKMLFRQLVYHFHPSVRHFVYQFTTSAESYPIITPCTALFFFFFFFLPRQFQISIVVERPDGREIAKPVELRVMVGDANDNRPTFPQAQYHTVVKELAARGNKEYFGNWLSPFLPMCTHVLENTVS